jgi:hypothetical protein
MRMIKSRRMRRTGHVPHRGRRGMHGGFWWESQKVRDHQEDLDIGGRIILKRILEKSDGLEEHSSSGVEGCCIACSRG